MRKSTVRLLLSGLLLAASIELSAAPTTQPPTTKPPLTIPPPKKEEPPRYKPTLKPELPPMAKPFGMPGVIGWQNGRWEGTDYLGFLSNNIGVDVEISKASTVSRSFDNNSVATKVADIFSKEGITPHSEATEGPPLPFLHILILVYPIDHERYVVLGNGRLFEQIQVIRKNFIPGGYWQGITWENQDIAVATTDQLDSQIQAVADKIGTAFAKRYRQYNINKEGMPGMPNTAPPPTPAMPPPETQARQY